MRKNLSVVRELELGLDEAVGELAWIHSERADISCDHVIRIGETSPEDDLEDSRAAPVGRAVDQSDKMGVDSDWRFRRGDHREHRTGDVDAGARTGGLAQGEVFNEEC